MFLPIYRNESRLRNSQDDHLDFIVYVFFDTRPAPTSTRLAFMSLPVSRDQITPTWSPAGAATSLGFTEFFGLAEVPSPTYRRYVQEADRVTEGLHRVAHSGVAREHRPGFGLNVLIGSREPDTAFVDAQRDRTGRGVLVEPGPFLHDQQHHVQALALAQRDRVSPTLLPHPFLAQAGDLGGQIEALQRSVQGPLGLWVRPRSHTLSFLELGPLIVISQECHYRTSNSKDCRAYAPDVPPIACLNRDKQEYNGSGL